MFSKIDFEINDVETLYDYSVLELAVEFWQHHGNYEKYKTETILNYEAMLEVYQPKIVPINLQDKMIYMIFPPPKKLKPHYYQAFTEGAYYGYDEKPFQKYLKNKDYPINVFAGQKTVFDNSFRTAELKWIETEMEHLMLVLADTDPWSVICPIPFPPDKDNLKVMLKNSNHSVKLKDFDEETRDSAVLKLKSWLGKTEKAKHEHIGQPKFYLRHYKKTVQEENDNPPVGILLLTNQNKKLVEYAIAESYLDVFVSKYQKKVRNF